MAVQQELFCGEIVSCRRRFSLCDQVPGRVCRTCRTGRCNRAIRYQLSRTLSQTRRKTAGVESIRGKCRFIVPNEAVSGMAEILVVDDAEFDRAFVGKVLEPFPGWNPEFLADGDQAIKRLQQKEFDLVLTDLTMPAMTGLELLALIRDQYAALPVVIMTGQASEQIETEALQRGAANFVAKQNLASELPGVIDKVLQSSRSADAAARLMSHADRAEFEFSIPNDQSLALAAIEFIQNSTRQWACVSESDLTRLKIALDEALSNAMIHGNLEVASDLREDASGRYEELIALRRNQTPYCNRKIIISVKLEPHRLDCVIRDQGPGFDVSLVSDPTAVKNLGRPSGRGLLLIRSFIDEVRYNAEGNEITLTMKLGESPPEQNSMQIDAQQLLRTAFDQSFVPCANSSAAAPPK